MARCRIEPLHRGRAQKFGALVLQKPCSWRQPLNSGIVWRVKCWPIKKLDSPELVNELVGREMRMLRKESLRVVLLDTRYHLIRIEEVSIGSVNESIAHPRDVFRPAVIASAYAVIVVHNHPSGDSSPSQTDHSLTRRLAEAAELLQIKLLDHIIIGARPSKARAISVSKKQACCENSSDGDCRSYREDRS